MIKKLDPQPADSYERVLRDLVDTVNQLIDLVEGSDD